MYRELHGSAERKAATFGLRKVAPRACVADSKPYLRAFLRDALENVGFVIRECDRADDLGRVLANELPDLVLLGIGADGIDAGGFLKTLVRGEFAGKVLAVGARDVVIMRAVQQVGKEYGLTMLPPLGVPFAAEALRDRIAELLPQEPPPSPVVHVGEALHAGWLELWYQPKFDARTLVRCGALALVRMRHPTWGVVLPARFIPEARDPYFRDLSEFVIRQALGDWRYLLERGCPPDISINLPAEFLRDPLAARNLYRCMPAHSAFRGLTIDIDSAEAINELGGICEIALDMGLHNVGLSINDIGANWSTLMDIGRFPFVELKVDAQFVTGCGNNQLKRTICRQVVELARGYGVRTVAVGVESRDDLVAVNEIGFDFMQGDLFGKPMPLTKFARSSLTFAAKN